MPSPVGREEVIGVATASLCRTSIRLTIFEALRGETPVQGSSAGVTSIP